MTIASSWEKLHIRHKDPGILLIAVWKICRGMGLVFVGLWTLAMWHENCPTGTHSHFLEACLHQLRFEGSLHWLREFLAKLGIMSEDRLPLICIGSFLYSVKLFVEGVGLWHEKIWAQYLTVTVTSLFLPWIVYKLIQRGTWSYAVALVADILIVAYLAYRLWQHKTRHAVSP